MAACRDVGMKQPLDACASFGSPALHPCWGFACLVEPRRRPGSSPSPSHSSSSSPSASASLSPVARSSRGLTLLGSMLSHYFSACLLRSPHCSLSHLFSAYMIFSNSIRPEVKAANPTAAFGEIAKVSAWQVCARVCPCPVIPATSEVSMRRARRTGRDSPGPSKRNRRLATKTDEVKGG